MNYSGIGTRFPTPQQATLCTHIGRYMAQHDWTLHTGAAEGIDQVFTRAALRAGGEVVLHIPWKKHEQEFRDGIPENLRHLVDVRVLKSKKSERDYVAFDSVVKHHPAPSRLSWGAACLHARNYRILVPKDEHPVELVVACPSPHGGGTMQGVRVAQSLEIPVIRLDIMSEAEAQVEIKKLVSTRV